jgi:helix-turn-helix protein
MSVTKDDSGLSTSWQTRFFTNAISMSEARKGICEIDGRTISLRAGSQSQTIEFDEIHDITVGSPPEKLAGEFDDAFGIKFTAGGQSRICFLDYDADRVEIFDYHIFEEIINGARGVVEYGAVRGGQQTDASSSQMKIAIEPERVGFNLKTGGEKEIALGDIVDMQAGKRTVGDTKRDVIKVDHMEDQTIITTYLSLVETRIQHLLNRYMGREFNKLQSEIADTEISETETELVIGYYTTRDIEQTMQTLTGGDKYEFESIYEEALDHGLVTHPDDGVGLTQKGRMLANTEIEVVNT